MKYYCLLSILLFSLIACGSSDDKEPQSEDVTIKCSPEKIEAVAQASQYVERYASYKRMEAMNWSE